MSAAKKWSSSHRFFLEIHQIKADWAHKADAKYRVAFMNRCLCLFFRALENIEKAEKVDFDHAWNMRMQLDDLANTGWEFFGPGDLNSALEHLARNHYIWTDSETDRYKGGKGKIFSRTLDAPEPFARFADALDERLAQLAADLRDYVTAAEATTIDASKDSWEACQKNLKRITGISKKVEDSLWLMDTVDLVKNQATKDFFKKTSKALGRYGGSATKFVDILGRIDAVATLKIKLKAATAGTGVSEEASDALAAIRATVDFLPVLGGLYAEALDAVPALVDSYRNSIRLVQRRLDSVFEPLPQSPPPIPICGICQMPAAKPCTRGPARGTKP